MRIEEYQPTPFQARFHESPRRYRALVGGVGSGKTTALLVDAVRMAESTKRKEILVAVPGGLAPFVTAKIEALLGRGPGQAGLFSFPMGSRLSVVTVPRGEGRTLLGGQWAAAYVTNAGDLTASDYAYLFTRIRVPGLDYRLSLEDEETDFITRLPDLPEGEDLVVFVPPTKRNPHAPPSGAL